MDTPPSPSPDSDDEDMLLNLQLILHHINMCYHCRVCFKMKDLLIKIKNKI